MRRGPDLVLFGTHLKGAAFSSQVSKVTLGPMQPKRPQGHSQPGSPEDLEGKGNHDDVDLPVSHDIDLPVSHDSPKSLHANRRRMRPDINSVLADARDKILHARNQHLRNHCGTLQWIVSGIFQRNFTCQWYFPKDCHLSSGFVTGNVQWTFSGIFQWMFISVMSGV